MNYFSLIFTSNVCLTSLNIGKIYIYIYIYTIEHYIYNVLNDE